MATNKGFIKDLAGNHLLPITRGELVLDSKGQVALHSDEFLAGNGLPGLMTAAEKLMLSGGGTGQSLSDVYTKLGYINNGLKFNGLPVNFYNANNEATPINITSAGEGMLSITPNGNTINLSLTELTTGETTASQILKSITVDKYGRVIAVSGSALTNAEIPEELTNKKLINPIITDGTTAQSEIANNDLAIVNKHYVDQKFALVNNTALGALKFVGPISNADDAITIITELKQANSYYKAIANFVIPSQYLYSETEYAVDQTVKIGDTLIVYPVSTTEHKWVYVPSGDEVVTKLTVREEGATATIDSKAGPITLQFSSIFNVEDTVGSGLFASIDMPAASATLSGHLTSTDWVRFNSYADSLKVEYVSNLVGTEPGIYQTGSIKVGTNNEYPVYGLNNISALSLENGETNEYNPILKFTETGKTDIKLTYKGIKGISIRKDGNNVEFSAVNEVLSESSKYLEIVNGYQFKAKIGSYDGTTVTDGLTDYNEFNEFKKSVAYTINALTEVITGSLNDTSEKYHYGSTDLVSVITVTI